MQNRSIQDTIQGDDSDGTKFQTLFDSANKRQETSLQIENKYKEHQPPIGVFMGWTGCNAIDVWDLLINKPDLGIRCCMGSAEERTQALALLNDPKPKLVVDLLSLTTLYCLGAADTVDKVFGKLCIAQSTIDELLQIIHEKEGMSIEKQDKRYVRHMINPKDLGRNVELLKNLIKWIKENCEVIPCTAALKMNQLRKKELDGILQPLFIDTLLIASQPGYLLLSDDEHLRTYAKFQLNNDAGSNFQIDGVWTQIVLEHCLNQNVLDKNEYNKMAIQLVCSNYYHTEFDSDTLMEALKQANWNLTKPYNRLVQTLGGQKISLQKALNITVDFLFKIWEEPILYSQRKYLTFGLLAGLTAERSSKAVLRQLANRIQGRFFTYSPTENHILRQIEDYSQFYPTIEDNFDFLSEDEIRIKGTRIGIETVLYASLHLSQTPEEIVENYPTLTLEEVYATILYYLQNPIKIGSYLADKLQFSQILREEHEKNPPPGVVRLRQLKAERQAGSLERFFAS